MVEWAALDLCTCLSESDLKYTNFESCENEEDHEYIDLHNKAIYVDKKISKYCRRQCKCVCK